MPLNVALVGAGAIAGVHLPALQRVSTTRVVGIFDQNPERAQERATEFGIPTVYPTWPALLADTSVECVAVLLPHDLHEQYASEALAAGKHVVCEKPLGQTVEECDRMLAVARQNGRRLFPVHNRVYDPATEKIKEIIDGGLIGEVYLVQTNGYEGPDTVGVRPWLGTKAGGGGVLLAQAVHPAYMLRWLLGDVAKVACLFGDRKVVTMTHEDTAIATLKFANGVVGEMTATFGIGPGPFDHQVIIHGRAGYLQLRSNPGDDRATQPFLLEAIAPKIFGDKGMHRVELPPAEGWWTGFVGMWRDYSRALTEGGPTRVTGEDGRAAVAIIRAAYQANATGAVVDILS
jgi:predicted dehydrogenase